MPSQISGRWKLQFRSSSIIPTSLRWRKNSQLGPTFTPRVIGKRWTRNTGGHHSPQAIQGKMNKVIQSQWYVLLIDSWKEFNLPLRCYLSIMDQKRNQSEKVFVTYLRFWFPSIMKAWVILYQPNKEQSGRFSLTRYVSIFSNESIRKQSGRLV